MKESSTIRSSQIEQIVGRIVERFHPQKIILFGSHARGETRPDSDVDLLVVMPVLGSKRRQAMAIDLEIASFGIPKDVIMITPEELARDRDVVGTIVYSALREGRVLHDERAA